MGVYFGTRLDGEIEDHGKAGVIAYVFRNGKRIRLGIFADRRSAIAAVAEDAEKAAAKASERPG
jgi:hypothetical protein